MKDPSIPRRPWVLPSSTVFEIKQTPESGRAVFAEQNLHHGAHVLTTTSSQSPLAHVILRTYRREVCAWCFAYDRGREWKLRDAQTSTSFCGLECQNLWSEWHDDCTIGALTAIESFTRSSSKHHESEDASADLQSSISQSEEELLIAEKWSAAEVQSGAIIAARLNPKPTKSQRASLRKAMESRSDPDILSYVVSGVIAAYKSRNPAVDHSPVEANSSMPQDMLPSLFELVPWQEVFVSNPMTSSPLKDYTSAYVICRALLPLDMLSYISQGLVINLASRAAHNAFSIRPHGTTDGEQSGEFFGWGVWPEASFFNHSCRPNLSKSRNGRFWSFHVDIDTNDSVACGEELCITYLGGDERDLDVKERRKRLSEQWGFKCLCRRCQEESLLTE